MGGNAMSEWKKVKLEDISTSIQTGPFGSQLHQSDYSEKGVPVVMPKDIIDGKVDDSSIARVEMHHIQRLSRYTISEGDILYPRRGDVGKCAFISAKQNGWLCGTGCLRVSINQDKANSRFIFFQLQKRDTIGWIENHAIGATMLNLNTSILSNVPIELPTLNTQRRIAEILSRYDSLIENYQRQIKLLEEAAQRLYKEWFVDLHFPGHENTPIIDGIPEDWVTPTDITRNFSIYLLNTEKKITKEGLEHSSAKMLPPETILMTSRASVGFFGLCDFEACTNQGFISCVPFRKNFQMYLLYNLMNRVDEIRLKAGGSTYLEISKSVFRDFDIIYPEERLLALFQTSAHRIIDNIRVYVNQIRNLTEARDRLLPKFMNGEIEVS